MKRYRSEDWIRDGLSFSIFSSRESKAVDPHTHDFCEIIYIMDGKVTETVNGTDRAAARGDLFFLNRECVHAFTPQGSVTYINVCFAPEVICRRIEDCGSAFDLLSLTAIEELQSDSVGCMRVVGEERCLIEAILRDMLAEYDRPSSEREAILENYMMILVSKIVRKLSLEPLRKKNEEMWSELLRYIDGNIGKRLSLSELAQKCFYNPSYFSRAFKERFGMTLSDYISRERASLSVNLLRDRSLSMEEIAERCGFCDRTAFWRSFTKRYGMSPSEYREGKI